jgi:DNA processing protein
MTQEEDKIYLNAFNLISGVGPVTMRKLSRFFGNFQIAWNATAETLTQAGLGPSLVETISSKRNAIDPQAEWEKLLKFEIRIARWNDGNYPPLLKEIPNPPYLLYYQGDLDACRELPIAVVGSRKYSSYGKQVTEMIVKRLSEAGASIVSGLALGIDGLAHRAALACDGKTVAVLGSSLDEPNIYPRHHFPLAQEIIQRGGCVMSEYPIPTPAAAGTFPSRNRLIAGMSLGTLVIEAGIKSGSLITAGCALEFNREVFAVPGSILSEQSEGTNALIKQGAKLVGNVSDILEELNIDGIAKENVLTEIIPDNKEEEIILKTLSTEPVHIDKISRVTKLRTMTVSSVLTIMEMKGWIKNIGGNNYIRIK